MGTTPADGNTKDVEIIALLQYICNLCRTSEIPLIVKLTSF